jgi:hypothetical protein
LDQETVEFKHTLPYQDHKTLVKEVKNQELVIKLKKKKLLMYRTELEVVNVKLGDLWRKCTLEKTVRLNGNPLEITVKLNKAAVKETHFVTHTKQEVGPTPRPYKNADGTAYV